MSDRLKAFVVVLLALAILFVLNVGYSAFRTISRLDAVEAERDRWQRPLDVIQALNLRPGNVVVDLGCGSGYFTLKLSPLVGDGGRVIAEDVRRLPLMFLWYRTVVRREHNVSIIRGERNDPDLPARVKAVLIANTYHEFTDSQSILARLYQSLASGGRLVVVDRVPQSANLGPSDMAEHEMSAERVERELRQMHFEILSRDDHFIQHDSYGENWWVIVARKP